MTDLKQGAGFHRGRSKQNYATPPDFREAIIKRFGFPVWDLAAEETNYFGPKGKFFDKANNSLIHDWHKIEGILWLNPPFDYIEPWAHKCSEQSKKGARILLLVPASVGAYWFQTHVHHCASHIYFLAPRICFDGKGPFPKDCILAHYNSDGKDPILTYYRCWRWK